MNTPLLLIGFMGSGKTQVGRLLARSLHVPFVDLDESIARDAGCGIPDLFAREGEDGFRRREHEALKRSLQPGGRIVSCGGGIIVRPENRDLLLAQPHVYCLRVSAESVLKRVGNDPNRPLLHGADPLTRIRELQQQRAPWYALFPHQIDTDGFRPSEVADRILSDLRNP
jgi:shikimate kinase